MHMSDIELLAIESKANALNEEISNMHNKAKENGLRFELYSNGSFARARFWPISHDVEESEYSPEVPFYMVRLATRILHRFYKKDKRINYRNITIRNDFRSSGTEQRYCRTNILSIYMKLGDDKNKKTSKKGK